MATLSCMAVFEQAADGTWTGYVPDMPLVLGTGNSKADAMRDLRVAVELWMEDRKARNLDLPTPSTEVLEVEVAA